MPESGHCYVHSQITIEDIKTVKEKYPQAKLIVHPECIRGVRELADYVGSTSRMYNYARDSTSEVKEFIIGTEVGLLERLAQDFPEKSFYLAKDRLVCYNMKKHNLELIKYLLENLDDKTFEVKVPLEIAKKALRPIEKMLDYS